MASRSVPIVYASTALRTATYSWKTSPPGPSMVSGTRISSIVKLMPTHPFR